MLACRGAGEADGTSTSDAGPSSTSAGTGVDTPADTSSSGPGAETTNVPESSDGPTTDASESSDGTSGDEPFVHAIWSLEGHAEISRDGADWAGSTDLDNPFTDNYPGFTVKCNAIETGENTGAGYIYTVDPTTDIAFSSVNPSLRAPRVFKLEALPELAFEHSGLYQTDFYIQRGDPTASDDEVMPASHWLQYWVAFEQSSTSGLPYQGGKLFYPCRDGHGSCHYYSYMRTFEASSGVCENVEVDITNDGFVSRTMVNLAGGFAEASDQIAPEGVAYPEGLAESDRGKLGTSDPENGVMHWHEWVLVKVHSYVSGMTAEGDWIYNYEEWWRRHGSPTWHKVMDWRSGENVCGAAAPFEWRLSSTNGFDGRRGHNVLRFPTTVGEANGTPAGNLNIYMADIVMATEEAHLPVYTDG